MEAKKPPHYFEIKFLEMTKLTFPFSFFLPVSGVTQVEARARGQIVRAWHVMMVISAHVVTRVKVGFAQPHLSRVTRFVSTVMAMVAVLRQDLGLQMYARAR